jgi:homoaconitate hydratase family protein/3-isopropylmalate dehydratase small subunit
MGMTIVEKIMAFHAGISEVSPGSIVDIEIDTRAARDFGGANVVKNIRENGLSIHDPSRTFFTFDCNPTGSDQKYAANQHICREFAREHGIRVYDIDRGIGTHVLIHEGYTIPGSTAVTTDSHANILGAVGAFGQGMGDRDIAAAWAKGKVWFKVPPSVKISFTGQRPNGLTAKDIVLNLLDRFGANSLLGYSVEMYGETIEALTLDERITIASMATEMGAIIILFPPNKEVLEYCGKRSGREVKGVFADKDAQYEKTFEIDTGTFEPRISRPGKPHDTVPLVGFQETRIDSAFIGSCTNGRMEDMRAAAGILKGRKLAPGVVLKIVPSTDEVWNQCLREGIIEVFKEAGALVSNAGCAGCAAGQVGQNGPNEVTISTGNRNFAGKQGKGEVYLASPATVAASAVAGYITGVDDIPDEPISIPSPGKSVTTPSRSKPADTAKPLVVEGRVWLIDVDNIDTDMIFHNRYLTITDINEMGQYTFDNLKGFEDFASKAGEGDIVVTGRNFGSGSSRQQAVDCFRSLGIEVIIARSFGAIYERNAINAAFPILTCNDISALEIRNGDRLRVDFATGKIENTTRNKDLTIDPFSEVQMEIYKNDGLF